jgi:CBS domain-containing protein
VRAPDVDGDDVRALADLERADLVGPETATVGARRRMRRQRVGCLSVIQDDRLVGIVTDEDLMEIASKLLEEQLGDDRKQQICSVQVDP